MGSTNKTRVSWRAARHIRKIAELASHEMHVIEPRWRYFEDGQLDLEVDDLRPLLDVPALELAHGLIAFTVLVLESRPAKAVAERLGNVSVTRVSRWRALGRDVPVQLAPRLVALARHWPE